MLGAALILVSLVFPRASAQAAKPSSAAAPSHSASMRPALPILVSEDDGGECGADPQVETIDCGDKLAHMEPRIDEPFIMTLLRAVELQSSNMSEQACTELLTDIWSQESCSAQSGECGNMNTGTPPAPAPKLASSSSSAQSIWSGLGLGGAGSRRLGRHANVRHPSSRDLQPPVPPPRILGH
ncbi:hypothetical protein DB30_06039 [Enhygromyxa salina]|uniref:Uncharacterized protein n=1 Tax=Enhygromyxa salina TaxID=215803 RepID=A0A0C2D4J1_9BACT|nr:hypothetical protein DB30_06039 [Enhygromyxa salina]